MQQQQNTSGGGGGGIDPQQAMQLAAMVAKNGKEIKQYQPGGYMQYAPKVASVNPSTGMVNSATGFVTKEQTEQFYNECSKLEKMWTNSDYKIKLLSFCCFSLINEFIYELDLPVYKSLEEKMG